MSEMFQSILVAADRYRGSNHTWQNAVTLAKKLRASLRLVYTVDFEDIKILAPGPPDGVITRRLLRGSAREAALVAEGRNAEREFVACTRDASIKCSSDVFVGPSETIWAEEGRSCDPELPPFYVPSVMRVSPAMGMGCGRAREPSPGAAHAVAAANSAGVRYPSALCGLLRL